MKEHMKLIRIFIGSPGGLSDERKAARDIFEEVNLAHGERWGLHFKIVAWEDTVPGYQRAQSKINEDLDRCEYFIGVLHDRWGTPPSNDPKGYTSGFEEEFYRAEEALKNGKMKDMALFFKAIEMREGFVPGPEIQKVLDFRQEQVKGKVNYFRDFSTLEEFKSEVRNKLNEIGWNESGLVVTVSEDDASQPKPIQPNSVGEAGESKSGLFDSEARSFISGLLDKSDDWDATQAFEAARLRLIAASISRSGNDEVSLGNHDANLIFQHLRDAKLSDQEYTTLIDSGVIGFDHCNIPLWRWLARREEHEHFPFYRLRLLATVGTEDEQRHAIRILQSLGEPIPTHDSYFNIHGVLETWFAEGTKDLVFDAAISFLSENGTVDDLPAVKQAMENVPANRKNKIESAIVGILAKQSVDDALKRICEHKVDKIDAKIVKDLFTNPTSLATETLVGCLSAKQDDIRLRSARILHERTEISIDTANTLLTDSSHDIRLVAVEALRQLDSPVEAEVVKKALTIEKATGFGLTIGKKETDTTVYDEYRRNRLFELSEEDLRQAMEDVFVFKQKELAVLYRKFRSRKHVLAEIRRNLADGFEAHFESELERAESKIDKSSKLINDLRDISMFHRTQLCNDAVSALCANRKSEDLDLVRQVLAKFSIKASTDVLNYLGRFGDWSDIARINSLADDQSRPANLLSLATTLLPEERALVILKLGKQRLADLLDCDLQYSIRVAVLKLMPRKSLVELTDDLLLRELGQKNDQSRIIFALRCVQSLPKTRIKGLLQKYVDGDQYRFYNSIHWLDLGASFPSSAAKQIAKRELARR